MDSYPVIVDAVLYGVVFNQTPFKMLVIQSLNIVE